MVTLTLGIGVVIEWIKEEDWEDHFYCINLDVLKIFEPCDYATHSKFQFKKLFSTYLYLELPPTDVSSGCDATGAVLSLFHGAELQPSVERPPQVLHACLLTLLLTACGSPRPHCPSYASHKSCSPNVCASPLLDTWQDSTSWPPGRWIKLWD